MCFISLTSLKREFWRRSGGKSATSARLKKVGRRGGNTSTVWREGKSSAHYLCTPWLGKWNFYLESVVVLWSSPRWACFVIQGINFNKLSHGWNGNIFQKVNVHCVISYHCLQRRVRKKAFSTDTRFLSGLFLKRLIRLAGNSQQQMWFVWNTETKS